MKTKNNFRTGSRQARSPYTLVIKGLILSAFLLAGINAPLQAQEDSITKPSWWFGAAAGANINYYGGSTQQLNSDLTVPAIFNDGKGVGLYLAPLVEFHRPNSRWGVMLQAGYDNRKGKFDEVTTPCNCPADLDAKITYLTVEPSLRFAPFKSNFYLYAGPRLAFNMAKSFTYKLGVNPDVPGQTANPDVKGDFSSMNKVLLSMQIGAGYDIPISSEKKLTQWVLSPFISFQPYFGQDPRSIETWNVTTLRIGATIKFGRGSKVGKNNAVGNTPVVVAPEVKFSISSPANIPIERRVRETFPISNYIFFEIGSSEISDRYVLLKKKQVKDFKEDQLEVFKPKKLSGRSDREMTVYYNVLNILGDRMVRYPLTKVRLSGSTLEGSKDGKEMAEAVKKYLVDIFGIDPNRITTDGSLKPRLASEVPGGKLELDLLREEDNRVSISSDSPEILMEYQTGPNVFLMPVDINVVQQAPVNSYVTFNVVGSNQAYLFWKLEIKDDKGVVQKFGPYSREKVSLPGKSILGVRPVGNFKVTMIGETKTGTIVKKEASLHMLLWTPPKDEMAMRFNIVYEFNSADAIVIYDKYIADIVTPKIPKGATVIIAAYTDIVGNADNNLVLSTARANDVKNLFDKALSKVGRTDVKFEVYGFGEDEDFSPFNNNYPEERFYNRSVIIDIIPQ